MDPSQYSVETFAPHLKTVFTAEKEPGITIPLQLVEVVAGASHPRVRQFSLVFRGPAEPRLAQHIFRLQHAVLGEMDLFLVPVGSEPEGVTYQAVFNRFVDASPQK
jgi:hypothetical protein